MSRDSRRSAAATVVVLLALLTAIATGCGGGGDGGDSSGATAKAGSDSASFGAEATGARARQAEAALHGYFAALAATEWHAACSHIAKPIRHALARIAAASKTGEAGEGCGGAVKQQATEFSPSELAALPKAEIDSVRAEGGNGYVIYRSSGRRYAMPTLAEEGRPKLAATSGTLLR